MDPQLIKLFNEGGMTPEVLKNLGWSQFPGASDVWNYPGGNKIITNAYGYGEWVSANGNERVHVQLKIGKSPSSAAAAATTAPAVSPVAAVYPAPYTGGADVVKAEHPKPGVTITTTASGAVVEQVEGGTPYTVSAAPPTQADITKATNVFEQEEGHRIAVAPTTAAVQPEDPGLKSGAKEFETSVEVTAANTRLADTATKANDVFPATPVGGTTVAPDVVTAADTHYASVSEVKSNDMIATPAAQAPDTVTAADTHYNAVADAKSEDMFAVAPAPTTDTTFHPPSATTAAAKSEDMFAVAPTVPPPANNSYDVGGVQVKPGITLPPTTSYTNPPTGLGGLSTDSNVHRFGRQME